MSEKTHHRGSTADLLFHWFEFGRTSQLLFISISKVAESIQNKQETIGTVLHIAPYLVFSG